MALVMTGSPAGEPISLAEVKTHLRIDHSAEDLYLGGLILTSRLQIEAALGLALMTQSWRLTIRRWPGIETYPLPMRPVTAITALHAVREDGTLEPLPLSAASLDAGPPPAIVRPPAGWPVPAGPFRSIAIDFTAGYGATATSVPSPIRQALLLLVAHWYERRDPYETAETSAGIPSAVSDLLLPYRSPRL